MGNNHKPKEVLIFGAGSFGEEVLDFLDDINCIHPTYRCIGFLDDEEKKWGGKLHGVPILGAFSESNKFPNKPLGGFLGHHTPPLDLDMIGLTEVCPETYGYVTFSAESLRSFRVRKVS